MKPTEFSELIGDYDAWYVSCFKCHAIAFVGVGNKAGIKARELRNLHNNRLHHKDLHKQKITTYAWAIRGMSIDKQPWRASLDLLTKEKFQNINRLYFAIQILKNFSSLRRYT